MPTPISVRLDEETGKRLDRLAKETGRTKAFYIRKMIEDRIDDMENYYLAAERLAQSRNSSSRSLTSAEARRELGLED